MLPCPHTGPTGEPKLSAARLAPLLAIMLMALATTVAAEPRTFESGIFTRDQAKDGEEPFEEHCGTCHEPEYFEGVFKAWNGESLASLFDVMAATMPQSNPGSLSNPDYVGILAYILDENDYPRGDETLSPYARGFDEITVTAP